MLTRVSDNMKFKTMTENMFKIQSQYAELEEKLATQKQINRPSDDPIGMGKILDYRASRAAIATYKSNAEDSESWLTMTESKLTSMEDLVVQAKEIAIAQGSATSDSSTRKIASGNIQSIIDEMLSLANSKMGDRYLFAGSDMTTDPFSASSATASVGAAQAANGNAFDGAVVSGGAYTGAVNKTYAVKIVTGGTLTNATYKVSADGGKTWGTEQTNLDAGTITLGDGITLTFTDTGTNRLSAGDIFYTQGTTAGYHRGNGNEMTVETSKGINFNYNITGEEALTAQGKGTVDVFKVLNDLKTGLENNDAGAILGQIDQLEAGRTQISQCTSSCGSRISSLDITKDNLTAIDQKISDLNSAVEDADMALLITEFSMKEAALKASYSISGQISNLSILDFIK